MVGFLEAGLCSWPGSSCVLTHFLLSGDWKVPLNSGIVNVSLFADGEKKTTKIPMELCIHCEIVSAVTSRTFTTF